jgi:mono/diheme cytochrome c family protein
VNRTSYRWLFTLAVVLAASAASSVVLASQAPAAKPEIKRVPAVATPADNGGVMFSSYCAACHGATGRGDGPAAPALKKMPADLTVLARNNGNKFPEARFRDVVGRNALVIEHGSSEMPTWGRIFREMPGGDATATLRLRNLLNYVKSIQR